MGFLREVLIQVVNLLTRFKEYLLYETLPTILSDFSRVVTYTFIVLTLYCAFIGSLALAILSPKNQMLYTFVTAYQYDYFGFFLDLPVITQRITWFLSLFIVVHYFELWVYPATYRKRILDLLRRRWKGR